MRCTKLSDIGFSKIGSMKTLAQNRFFNGAFLYKMVSSPQEAIACGGVAITSMDGAYQLVFGGEALAAWVRSGAGVRVPMQACRNREVDPGTLYAKASGVAYKPKEMDCGFGQWVDMSALASEWTICGVITKCSSLFGASAGLLCDKPLLQGTPITSWAELTEAGRCWKSGLTDVNMKIGSYMSRADRFAMLVAVPWHSSFRALLGAGATAAIGTGDGSKFIRAAYEQHLAVQPDFTPALNLTIVGSGTSLAVTRGGQDALLVGDIVTATGGLFGESKTIPQDVNNYGEFFSSKCLCSLIDVYKISTPYDGRNGVVPGTEFYAKMATPVAVKVLDTGMSFKTSLSLGGLTVCIRNFQIGGPMTTEYGVVPRLGVKPNSAAGTPGNGTTVTATNVVARIGGWDVRPFMSTVLPRYYFAETGEALTTVGVDIAVSDLLSDGAQVVTSTTTLTPTSDYVGTQKSAATAVAASVVYPPAEQWPYDLVSQVTKWWDAVYDTAESLAKAA